MMVVAVMVPRKHENKVKLDDNGEGVKAKIAETALIFWMAQIGIVHERMPSRSEKRKDASAVALGALIFAAPRQGCFSQR